MNSRREQGRPRVALIPGDGIGPEVITQARRVIDALDVGVDWVELAWGTELWLRTGEMMPEDAIEMLGDGFDAVLLGAVGDPRVSDEVTLWGLLLALRQGLDLWANERPVSLLPGVPSPLREAGPEEIDMLFIRENSEGEYSGVGGRVHRSRREEVGVETAVFTAGAIERVARHAFECARARRGHLISATKSNASRYGYVLWDEVVSRVGEEFPDVGTERILVDALAARMVSNPASIDVVVASNLFGDILTDIGAAIQGGMGMAASANVAPGADRLGIFEPVHGSAPDIAGRGMANPIGAVWSGSLLLDHIGMPRMAEMVRDAVAAAIGRGVRTRDLGGTAGTIEMGDAIVDCLEAP
ncbi:MAG TPA: isocitrate/isopropylmalate family dehydrogenase [Solirubrobacterales bacterium]|nr:isocitrate/isopropylmalate family dehydrogenase [Solirubrobacterales bacterium]